jgi:hypothetical protein
MSVIVRRLLAHSCLLLGLLALAGCGTPGRVADSASVRTVGIISAVPETLELYYAHGWGTRREVVNVQWEISKTVAAEAQRRLPPRYAPTVISTTASVDYVYELANWFGSTGSMSSDVAKLVKPGEYDAVLVITAKQGCAVHYSVPSVPARFPAYIALGYRLELFDGRTFKPMASRNVSVASPRLITGEDNPHRDVDFGWRGEPFAAIPEHRRQAMRTFALQIIGEGLTFTLPRLGLQ